MDELIRLYVLLTLPTQRPGQRHRDDRGDVPGWVLITVMTAGLVAILYKIAGNQLADLLRSALHKVS